ncbi:TPA: glycosyltransferase [Candidatus Micrarchaeota archaeon]|nr:glycosyltransferase [Candidatus Micrarchaeota archaeon]
MVPALNEEGNCLKSIRGQKTDFDFEIILSDSGSEDSTVKIGGKIVGSGKGIANGRNAGAEAAGGRVLVFVDSDSSIPPNYLDVVVPVLDDRGIAEVSNCFRFYRESRKLKIIENTCNSYLLLKGLSGKAEILGFNNAVGKADFKKVDGYPRRGA